MALGLVARLLACPAFAQDGRTPAKEKPKATADKAPDIAIANKAPDIEASRFCANASPSIAEARIAWEAKQLGDLDAQVKQRLADLEKAEAAMQDWVAKRDAMLKSATDGAILNEMEAERASRLAVVLSGAAGAGKKS
jgi:flagellar motility protein MotE (MotC chaperone)